MIELGRFLYRFRAAIAVPFLIVLVIMLRPARTFFPSLLLAIPGLLLRVWAAGYIGTSARSTRFSTEYRIISGPYRCLKHPLYLGNLLLVLGVVILFHPPLWYGILVITLFIIIYSIITVSEYQCVKALPRRIVRFAWVNARGELSTISVVGIIYLIYLTFLMLRL